MTCLRCFAVTLAALVVAGSTAAAAQDQARLAITDLSQVDEDYALQGEYQGQAKIAQNGRWRHGAVGLQVVALGGGQFDGVLYPGGLPGAGWSQGEKQQLSGAREGGTVRLQHGPLVIDVDGSAAAISYPGYSAHSRIAKVLRVSPTAGQQPPRQAVVLFDGSDTNLFANGRMTDDGLLMEGADTRDAFLDFTMHLEFQLPYMPNARGQGRANSGVYLQSRYEVQILDSFGLDGAPNECGGLYKQRAPEVNACFPPLRWQTYDLAFTSSRFDDDGEKTANARLTVRQNGVVIHDNVELAGKTGAGQPEGPQALPTKLQNHGDPVRFRNIWLVEDDGASPGEASPPVRLASNRYVQGGDSTGASAGGYSLAAGPVYGGVSVGNGVRYYGSARVSGPTPLRPSADQRYYGYIRLYPRPLHQYRQMEYNPFNGGYAPIDYYSPVPPDRYGYWTW